MGRRRQELSIRMALGAGQRRVAWMVMTHALALTAAGSVAGVLVAVALARGLGRFLFGVVPSDGLTLAAALAVVIALSAVAAFVPARSASRTNLVEGLRAE